MQRKQDKAAGITAPEDDDTLENFNDLDLDSDNDDENGNADGDKVVQADNPALARE